MVAEQLSGSEPGNGTFSQMTFVMRTFISSVRFAGLFSDVDHAIVATVVSISASAHSDLGNRITRADFSAPVPLLFVDVVIATSAATVVAGNLPYSSFIVVILFAIITAFGLAASDLTVLVDFGALDELELRLISLGSWDHNGCAGRFLDDDLLGFLADYDGLRWIRAREILDGFGVFLDIVGIPAGPLDLTFISIIPFIRAAIRLSLAFVSLDADISIDSRWRRRTLEAFNADFSPLGFRVGGAFAADDASLFKGITAVGTTISITVVYTQTIIVFITSWDTVALDGGKAGSIRRITGGSIVPVSISIPLSFSLSDDD